MSMCLSMEILCMITIKRTPYLIRGSFCAMCSYGLGFPAFWIRPMSWPDSTTVKSE